MPICAICDDTGLMNSDSANPTFCYCSAGKQARRQRETEQARTQQQGKHGPPSFIDIAQLDQVNANVDAMRASLLGSPASAAVPTTKFPAVQLLYRVAHPGHEISMSEAAQLHDLAKSLEHFFGDIALIGRKKG